jgi:hypothetical protein
MESARCSSEGELEFFQCDSSLTGQPLPKDGLALEILEGEISTPLTSLSAMLAGWSTTDREFQRNEDGAIITLTEREAHGGATTLERPFTAIGATSGAKEVGNADAILQKEMTGNVNDGLFNDLDFDNGLSQEI